MRVDEPVSSRDNTFRMVRASRILCLSLIAFVILTVRFSPNWAAVYFGINEIKVDAPSSGESAVIEKAFLSGYSARGAYVIKQAFDLGTEIDDPNHKIVRWRLLVPALGHFLKLPSPLLLGLAHLGCVVLIILLVGLSMGQSAVSGRAGFDALFFSIAAGASAPFFTSMGLLGYYDSWLAVALVAVSFAQQRWVVLIACLLAPWVDERFVIGLPLALCVRWIRSTGAAESPWQWLKVQAVLPLILVALYALVRLRLGGSGGSQTVADYLNQFIFSQELTVADYIVGALAGLRAGWFFVAAAIIGSWIAGSSVRLQSLLLSLGLPVTALLGLFTAMDLSRSMVLLYPVVPLGCTYAARTRWWKRFHVAPLLALSALVLPAYHVIGSFARPVDSLWSPPTPLADAYNTLGVNYFKGDGFVRSDSEALKWFRKAADQNHAGAEYNLGVMYAQGTGTARDHTEAVSWFRRAAVQGLAMAQYNLGVMYYTGAGIGQDSIEAAKWFRKAAEQGIAPAQRNLGVMYFQGDGVVKDSTEAVKWFRKAAQQGYAPAQSNLGGMYFHGDGVEKDFVRAKVWWQAAAEKGDEDARKNLLILEKQLSAEQEAQAAELARKLIRKPSKRG